MSAAGRLAVIAGRGTLPAHVAAALEAPLVVSPEGFVPDGLTPDLTFRLERLVPLLDHLTREGVTQVIFAGAVERPRLDPALFDPATAQLVPQLLAALQSGDDAALRVVMSIFEEAGGGDRRGRGGARARARSGHPLRRGDRGRPARCRAGGRDRGRDRPCRRGAGGGRGAGLCLGLEALPAPMRCSISWRRRARGCAPTGRARGLLYKAPKPGQDLRADMPSIGPETVHRAATAGLGGIAWQAGGALLLEREETVARAELAGLFLWAREP